MALTVIKRDGSKRPFLKEKVTDSVFLAAQDAELSEEEARELAEKAAGPVLKAASAREEISTLEIRNLLMEQLEQLNPAVVAAWKRHETEKAAVQ